MRYVEDDPIMKDVREFVNELSKPMFVYRMARARMMGLERQFGPRSIENSPQRGQYVSARTRMRDAALKIDGIVIDYAQSVLDRKTADDDDPRQNLDPDAYERMLDYASEERS